MTFVMRSLDIALRILDRVLKKSFEMNDLRSLDLAFMGGDAKTFDMGMYYCIILSKDNHLKP